jgi:hypothetical protein
MALFGAQVVLENRPVRAYTAASKPAFVAVVTTLADNGSTIILLRADG